MGFFKKYYNTVDKHRPPIQAGGLTIFDLFRPLYDVGKKDGHYAEKREGYVQAANKYEKRLIEQARQFLNQKSKLEDSLIRRDELLNECENHIKEKESIIGRLNAEQVELLETITKMRLEILRSK